MSDGSPVQSLRSTHEYVRVPLADMLARHMVAIEWAADRLHESEPFDGIDPVSRATRLRLFSGTPRSSRSVAFSRRSRCSSVRSSVVRPSGAQSGIPISACATQFRNALRRRSYSRASDSGLRPLLTSSLIDPDTLADTVDVISHRVSHDRAQQAGVHETVADSTQARWSGPSSTSGRFVGSAALSASSSSTISRKLVECRAPLNRNGAWRTRARSLTSDTARIARRAPRRGARW